MKASSTRPRISVAMATYNGEKYIREQLDSLARQTLLPVELVVTDDGSNDETLQIVEDFARRAPFPVRVFRNETRLGYADNFIKAASLCQGDWIAFCDQDDIWMDQKLSVCADFLADKDVILAAHSAWTLLNSGERGHLQPRFRRTQVLEPGSANPLDNPNGFAIVMNRGLLNIADLSDRPRKVFAHDPWFWFLATSIGRVATIAEPMAFYRQHESNVCGTYKLTFAQRLRRTAGILHFDELAESELACSRVLIASAEQHPERRDQLRRSAKQLEYRSRLHRIRTKIYRRKTTFPYRVMIFGHILLLGGYLPDPSGTRLGIANAIKDMLWGVCGAYKLIDPVASSPNVST